MTHFTVEAIEPMRLAARGRLTNMYTLSPFVWAEGEARRRAAKMAEAWYGESPDGLNFTMDEGPTLFPGPDKADLDGCEDPTVIVEGGQTHVWYTGWNQADKTGCLLHAEGPDPRTLAKTGVAIASTPAFINPKEATVVRAGGGDWRLFFEFARDDASRLGVAAANLDGPWKTADSALVRREQAWDNWHLSTGPIIDAGTDRPIMFYNGATKDAHWRIGWAVFDGDGTTVLERCDQPLITPEVMGDGATDIAFAASAVERGDRVWLYYSISDATLMRATLRRG